MPGIRQCLTGGALPVTLATVGDFEAAQVASGRGLPSRCVSRVTLDSIVDFLLPFDLFG